MIWSLQGPPLLYIESIKLLNFIFNADLGPAFHSNADPDPASKNYADPSGSATVASIPGLCIDLRSFCVVCRRMSWRWSTERGEQPAQPPPQQEPTASPFQPVSLLLIPSSIKLFKHDAPCACARHPRGGGGGRVSVCRNPRFND
jgi:hypothetical protein